MDFTQLTPADRRAMLARIGVESPDDLFAGVPADVRLDRPLCLPPALSEMDLRREVESLARENQRAATAACFAGAGAYDHYIPAVVDALASRGEFVTAYTPYQAEASQGVLQAFFEFQSMICTLTGMDVANASMYEAASALAEAVLMLGESGRRRVVVCEPIHPQYLSVMRTYLADLPLSLEVVPHVGGLADLAGAAKAMDNDTAAVVVQSPNLFGLIDPGVAQLAEAAHAVASSLVHVFDPISLGLFRRPGDLGADVAVGEGQPLGLPLSFGGPYLGLLAVRESLVRRIPGRLVGRTTDAEGRVAYCLTLQTREQHIRRAKATSNICTNEGLCALRATVYLAAMGPTGLRQAAEQSTRKAHQLATRIAGLGGYDLAFPGQPMFREFAVRCRSADPERIVEQGLAGGLLPGVPMGRLLPEMSDCLLIACTEKRTPAEMDSLVDLLSDCGGGQAV